MAKPTASTDAGDTADMAKANGTDEKGKVFSYRATRETPPGAEDYIIEQVLHRGHTFTSVVDSLVMYKMSHGQDATVLPERRKGKFKFTDGEMTLSAKDKQEITDMIVRKVQATSDSVKFYVHRTFKESSNPEQQDEGASNALPAGDAAAMDEKLNAMIDAIGAALDASGRDIKSTMGQAAKGLAQVIGESHDSLSAGIDSVSSKVDAIESSAASEANAEPAGGAEPPAELDAKLELVLESLRELRDELGRVRRESAAQPAYQATYEALQPPSPALESQPAGTLPDPTSPENPMQGAYTSPDGTDPLADLDMPDISPNELIDDILSALDAANSGISATLEMDDESAAQPAQYEGYAWDAAVGADDGTAMYADGDGDAPIPGAVANGDAEANPPAERDPEDAYLEPMPPAAVPLDEDAGNPEYTVIPEPQPSEPHPASPYAHSVSDEYNGYYADDADDDLSSLMDSVLTSRPDMGAGEPMGEADDGEPEDASEDADAAEQMSVEDFIGDVSFDDDSYLPLDEQEATDEEAAHGDGTPATRRAQPLTIPDRILNKQAAAKQEPGDNGANGQPEGDGDPDGVGDIGDVDLSDIYGAADDGDAGGDEGGYYGDGEDEDSDFDVA